MVLEAGIDGESLVGSVTRASYFPLFPYTLPLLRNGTVPTVQLLGSWPSGEGWLMSWFSTLDALVLASLDERTDFLSFP